MSTVRRKRLGDSLRIAADHLEIGARGGVWLRRALLPIPQGAERNTESHGELLLCQAERAANNFRLRHGNGLEDFADDVVGCHLFCFGFVGQNHAMPQDIRSDILDVLRRDVTASREE